MENKSSGLYRYYESLPIWARGVVGIAVVAGVGVLSYAIYKKVKKAYELEAGQATADSAEEEYKKLLKQGQKLSFPVGDYISTANSIADSLDGCESWVGEEEAMFAVINRVKKPIDWYYLIKTFGSRMIDNCGIGTGETAYALPELLRGQLGNISPSTLSMTTLGYLNTYLKKQIGITI